MLTIVRRLSAAVSLAGLLGLTSSSFGGYGTDMGITPAEIAQLPKFCWEQMESPFGKGPAFRIPQGCGVGMNHYCPGLLLLLRAKGTADRPRSSSFLGRAEQEVNYTVKALSGYPNCPIRAHVEATRAEIERLKKLKTP